VIKSNKKQHPYFYHLRGNFLMHHVQFEKAIVEFKKANLEWQQLGVNGFSFSHYNLGLCYEKLGQAEEAIKHYEKSYLSVHSAEALNALGHASYNMFQENNQTSYLQLAEKYYRKALEISPNYNVLVFNIGMLEIAKGHYKEASEHFNRCLELDPNFHSCTLALIKASYLNGQVDLARQVISTLDSTEQTLTDLLAIHYELGYHDKALELAGNKQDYKTPEFFHWKGYNEYALDMFEKAEKSFKKAVALGGKSAYIYFALGQTQLLLRKPLDCLQSAEAAYKLDPREDTKHLLEECRKLSQNTEEL
jgi:tetratricopeptide (TPR) repeat protein